MILEDDHRCFICGPHNPDGLRLHWIVEEKTMRTEFIPPAKYQGWKGIVHGGILASLLDEAMTRLAGILYQSAVTAEMNVRYVAPAKIGELLLIQGKVMKESKRLVEMKAEIHSQSSQLIAHSVGKVMLI